MAPDVHSPSANSVSSFHTADESSPWKNPHSTGRDGSPSPDKAEDSQKAVKAEKAESGESAARTAKAAKSPKRANSRANTSRPIYGGYRPVRRLPYELRDHARVFLEERMYGEAIHLLTSLLAAGGSPCAASASSSPPLWVPPPSHLAVLATLMVHPAYTTRPKNGTDVRVTGHALQYLRHILAVAGPVQAGLSTAFAFPDSLRQQRRTSGTTRGSGYNTYSNSNNASAASSRPHSRPRRLRAARAALNSADTDYVDVTRVQLGDDDDYSADGNGRGRLNSVSAALRAHAARGGSTNNNHDSSGDHSTHRTANGEKEDDKDYGSDHGGTRAAAAADEYALYLNGDDGDDDAVGARMATRDSVWVRGHDFWRVAGWALSCSVCEPARWTCWRPWLSLVVDVLEADLVVRVEEANDGPGSGHGNGDGHEHGNAFALQDSLLFSYLDGHTTHTNLRRVLTAIVADGSQSALQLHEVFDKETVVADGQHKSTPSLTRTRVLNLDNNEFGDYSDDEESAPPSSPLAPAARGRQQRHGRTEEDESSQASDHAQATSSRPGFVESLPLRRRLFYLLVLAAHYFRDDFVSIDTVYRTFADVLRESDISVFASFIAAPAEPLPTLVAVGAAGTPLLPPPPAPDTCLIGLLRHVLFPLMPLSAPKPHNIDPSVDDNGLGVTSIVLEKCFLPFAANTVALGANVRMALALESLFKVLWSKGGSALRWTASLQEAAKTGVQARATRSKAPKRSTEVETLGRDMLRRSGQRLLTMVKLSKLDA